MKITDFIITSQRFVLIIDELDQERTAQRFCQQLVQTSSLEDQDDDIKHLKIAALQDDDNALEHFLEECAAAEASKWNVILPTLADFLCYKRPAEVFQFLHKLHNCPQVARLLLWISVSHLKHPVFMVAACEYMADMVLRLSSRTELSIITRKAGGGVSNKRYSYSISKDQFTIEPLKRNEKSPSTTDNDTVKPEQLGTFKIELEEEELVARNSLKLPYEKTSEDGNGDGNIIYTPDAADDFDDEDPDEDLCI